MPTPKTIEDELLEAAEETLLTLKNSNGCLLQDEYTYLIETLSAAIVKARGVEI